MSESGIDLFHLFLAYDPKKRITVTLLFIIRVAILTITLLLLFYYLKASSALQHSYFRMSPYPKEAELMPTFPTNHITGVSEP